MKGSDIHLRKIALIGREKLDSKSYVSWSSVERPLAVASVKDGADLTEAVAVQMKRQPGPDGFCT